MIIEELKAEKIVSVVKSGKNEVHVKHWKDFGAAQIIAEKYGYGTIYGFLN